MKKLPVVAEEIAGLQSPTATRFSTGVAFLNDVSFLLILRASNATSSRNGSPVISITKIFEEVFEPSLLSF